MNLQINKVPYPSGLRGKSAKLLFGGSNPLGTSTHGYGVMVASQSPKLLVEVRVLLSVQKFLRSSVGLEHSAVNG